MNFQKVKEKFQSINWKNVFLSRNFIIICTVLLLGAGIVVVSALTNGTPITPSATNSGTKVLGNAVLVGNEVSEPENETADSYFAVAVINRERTRDDAMSVLQTIADSPDAMPNDKENALVAISKLVDEMNAEARIETLVKSKGFEECVAVFSGKKCSVIVETEGLMTDEVAQILAIAVEQTGLTAQNINIIPHKTTTQVASEK